MSVLMLCRVKQERPARDQTVREQGKSPRDFSVNTSLWHYFISFTVRDKVQQTECAKYVLIYDMKE